MNGRQCARLEPNEKKFVLKKCRQGMKYSCVLVIMTASGVYNGKLLAEVCCQDKKTQKNPGNFLISV